MDFQAKITNGSTRTIWVDNATPSRINPLPDRQQTFWLSSVGQEITVTATVDSVSAPLDGALGGRLFYYKWAEWPTPIVNPPPAVVITPGQSSVMTFIPLLAGHYTFVIRRQSGGGILIPFEVE